MWDFTLASDPDYSKQQPMSCSHALSTKENEKHLTKRKFPRKQTPWNSRCGSSAWRDYTYNKSTSNAEEEEGEEEEGEEEEEEEEENNTKMIWQIEMWLNYDLKLKDNTKNVFYVP